MDDNEELAALLADARKGDQQALADLLHRLRPLIRQRAQGRLGQGLGARVDCSDIAQEVHIQAWRNFDQFRGESVPQLLSWLDQIVTHAVTDCRREHGAAKRDAGREEGGSAPFARVEGYGTTPSQGAVRNEEQARLSEALLRLPEQQRLVFCLRFHEGLPFEEVARRVGVTETNARVLMVRATERLRNELGEGHD
jgi:RNA polymerase sigma-70 factor (ECF subfamily)